jgi:DNA-binding NtrC family response regulator
MVMRKILIVDNQNWIVELFNDALRADGYLALILQDAERILEYIKIDRFDLVLLSLYLKYGYDSWKILRSIKVLKPNLPVLILAAYDKYLYTPQLELAQGYVINSWSAPNELRQKVNAILEENTTTCPNEEAELAI